MTEIEIPLLLQELIGGVYLEMAALIGKRTGEMHCALARETDSQKFTPEHFSMKIRIHGDYHLGQLLYTGNDFYIIDFEGEPARSISERRLKRSPLRDVAGMIRSFHYPVYSVLYSSQAYTDDEATVLEAWAEAWYTCVAGTFLKSYLDTVQSSLFIPRRKDEMELMLHAYLMEKAIYEVGYELNNRPDWVDVPLRGILTLLRR